MPPVAIVSGLPQEHEQYFTQARSIDSSDSLHNRKAVGGVAGVMGNAGNEPVGRNGVPL